MLIEVGAFFADEAVIPGGGFVPGGVGGGSARAVWARGCFGVGTLAAWGLHDARGDWFF